jgi:hypothetical protein
MARTYKISEENLDTIPAGTRGVYIMGTRNGDGVIPFNVGSSEDVLTRLKQHLSDSEENMCIRRKVREGAGRLRFYYEEIRTGDLTFRENQLYDELIRAGFTLCNKQVPKA